MNRLIEFLQRIAGRVREGWRAPLTRRILFPIFYLVAGGVTGLLVIVILVLNSRDDLSVWHETRLVNEFEVGSDIETFSDYVALEEELFREVEDRIYRQSDPGRQIGVSRYLSGSEANPSSYPVDWNRTFEWKVKSGAPKGGVLLLHGMSDSPYSIRHLAEALHRQGMHVIGLRLPGHGTAPSGLKFFDWKDMDAAVILTMKHLEEEVGTEPLYLVGYSNGGALAVHYAGETLLDPELPKVDGIVLCSPAIGVTPAASLAIWQRRMGYVLGLEKLAWNAIGPEYDPYKYISFAVNAGVQVHDLTVEIKKDIARLKSEGKLEGFPPVLAFQSIVDATVSTPALIEVLFAELPENDHELVLFDINRKTNIESVLKSDPFPEVGRLIQSKSKDYVISFVTNMNREDGSVRVHRHEPGKPQPEVMALQLDWPDGLYSLSHIAIPFPPDDPLYGVKSDPGKTGYHIGDVALRGERGVLAISAADQLRLRYNPFFQFLREKVFSHVSDALDE